ncbi:unnamed protein product [Cyclocybe aegerita]|uniref:Uncharacterized protein n=1 Tax=Cyclocybe aegerita TaxID=1973307 RepID=A0A8S0XRC6_CYCAE|nr:unnamed protein product [Cyclocybe aegerita]
MFLVRLLDGLRIQDAVPLIPARATPQTRPLPLPPPPPYHGDYPAHILETYGQIPLSRPYIVTDDTPFIPLWRQVLAYWFPCLEGFTLEENWYLRSERLPFLPATEPASFAILLHGQPILLLRLHGVTEFESLPARASLRSGANRMFDSVALWSGHPALCVVSAIGAKWNAFLRPTDMTSAEAENVLGYDWYGEWKGDVVSAESHRALGQYFKVLKASRELFIPPLAGGD